MTAVEALLEVAEDAELKQAADLVDLRGRVCSLLAQAYLDAGRPNQAIRWLRAAARAFRATNDAAGLDAARKLQDRALTALGEQRQQLKAAEIERHRNTSVDAMLNGIDDPDRAADALLARAAAIPEEAADLAARALAIGRQAGSPRARVLARLALAHSAPADAAGHLQEAWIQADEANDFNLVGAIARTAKMLGVELPTQHGAHLAPRPSTDE